MAAFNSFVRYLPVVGACFLLAGCKPTITFTALESSITTGNSTTLDWEVELAKGAGIRLIEIKPDIGEVDLEGSITVSPEETTTYTLSTQSFAFGFPFFIDEKVTVEVTDGDTWFFDDINDVISNGWLFFRAGYIEEEEEDFNFVGLAEAEILGEVGLQVSAKHDDKEESDDIIFVGTVHKTGLESNTGYEISVSVKYVIGARRDASDSDCNKPILGVQAYASLEPTATVTTEGVDQIQIEDYDTFTKHELSSDITISDDVCEEGSYDISDSIGAVSTGLNAIDVTTDSDGDVYISFALEAEYADFELYIISVSASYEEQ